MAKRKDPVDETELMRRKLSAERFTRWFRESGQTTSELVAALGGLDNAAQTLYNWRRRGVPADKALLLSLLPPPWPKRSAHWFRGETEDLPIAQEGQEFDPLAMRREQLKHLIDRLDEDGLDAIQEEYEKIERIKQRKEARADIRKKAG